MESENENNYCDVVEKLMNMFGKVMSEDVISAIVENFKGDLNLSVDAIMSMSNDGNIIEEEQPTAANRNIPPTQIQSIKKPVILLPPSNPFSHCTTRQTSQPSTSYAVSAAKLPEGPQRALPNLKHVQYTSGFWTDQVKQIITDHNQGNRTLILMRGMPGSGKSYLARQLVDMMIGPSPNNYKSHILTTDEYFMVRGQYQYEKYKLSEAHSWNQTRAREACIAGLSPIIIDNTNIENWEMKPYVTEGVMNGYIIEVVEPKTPWSKNANQLAKKNLHNVPIRNIRRMLTNYCDGVTGQNLIRTYGLAYPNTMIPPKKRTVPLIDVVKEESTSQTHIIRSSTSTVNVPTQQVLNFTKQRDGRNASQADIMKEKQKLTLFVDAQKKLEEIEKVEKDWDNSDNWEFDNQASAKGLDTKVTSKLPASATVTTYLPDAKPPRKPDLSLPVNTSQEDKGSLMEKVHECEDWTKISAFMPAWTESSEPSSASVANQNLIPKLSNGTCFESGDNDLNGEFKVMTATPRDINEFNIESKPEKIPYKRMLDKSCLTNEAIITHAYRCPNEDKHFEEFRKLFKNIARSDLRDIFDKCCGDVNWSVEIVLDGMNNNQIKTVDSDELSDPDDENVQQCACLAKYNVIPDVATRDLDTAPIEEKQKVTVAANGSQTQKKKRSNITMSEKTIEMKRQIEKNVVIADDHYSEHCLKLRKIRRGEPEPMENKSENVGATGLSPDAPNFESKNIKNNLYSSDDDDGSGSDVENDEIVTVHLGSEFITGIDQMFGRNDMQYPDHIVPKISIPMSKLNEINALWLESLAFQLDDHAKQTSLMLQKDEEFARQIAAKDAELSIAGKDSQIPDLKEIMDMEMALAVYQKDVSEWRNNLPTDMAAKMTRDKLYNLFPDVNKDTLTEVLMAHDHNFHATVEVLLASSPRKDLLKEENGVSKFIAFEEKKLKDKIMQEQKDLSEEEWPLMSQDVPVDLDKVRGYRQDAAMHLRRRNQNQQKAEDYYRRGMTETASFYSKIANFHKQNYENSNGLAVTALMQYHAARNPDSATLDLHFLHVKEARESLNIFLDHHISKLRASGTHRNKKLFFITGRGKNSQHQVAVLRPVTTSHLERRGLSHMLQNPGLLASRVDRNTKLTCEISDS